MYLCNLYRSNPLKLILLSTCISNGREVCGQRAVPFAIEPRWSRGYRCGRSLLGEWVPEVVKSIACWIECGLLYIEFSCALYKYINSFDNIKL